MKIEREKQMILKFLERNYPVTRIKVDMRFKRAIILDDGSAFLLGDGSQTHKLKFKLQETIKKVFSSEDSISSAILDNFLRLS